MFGFTVVLVKGLGLRKALAVEAGALGGPLVGKARTHRDLHFHKARGPMATQ